MARFARTGRAWHARNVQDRDRDPRRRPPSDQPSGKTVTETSADSSADDRPGAGGSGTAPAAAGP
ncbi:hypothetical protein, partial [Actinomadura logoneensis]|uniref:hypothetical protein n=1 Tax=Actinomadura logoneensis TaxID=2293572 RepID=UPI0038B2A3B4